MTNLEPIAGTELTAYVVQILAKSNIQTVREFISQDTDRMSRITRLSFFNVVCIRDELRLRHGPKRIRHLWPTDRAVYHTGINALDNMLSHFSSLSAGSVWEICGSAGTGKTQLCHTIALNFVSNQRKEDAVLYIDTKGDFSGTRIRQMLRGQNKKKSECDRCMQQIKVERTNTAAGVINVLEQLLLQLKSVTTESYEGACIKLVVIDSLPAVWFRFNTGKKSFMGKYLLGQLSVLVNRLAMQHLVAFVLVNLSFFKMNTLLEKDLQCSGTNVDVGGNCMESKYDKSMQGYNWGIGELEAQQLSPALGRYWNSIPRIRLSIEVPNKTEFRNEHLQDAKRIIKVVKSCSSQTGISCQVRITNAGII